MARDSLGIYPRGWPVMPQPSYFTPVSYGDNWQDRDSLRAERLAGATDLGIPNGRRPIWRNAQVGAWEGCLRDPNVGVRRKSAD